MDLIIGIALVIIVFFSSSIIEKGGNYLNFETDYRGYVSKKRLGAQCSTWF